MKATALLLAGMVTTAAEVRPLKADLVVVEKSTHTMTVFSAGQQVAMFKVALGRGGRGKKECEGDNRVPEGSYTISGRKEDSAYHRSLRISYPSAADITNAKAKGCEPGGDIMIHGIRNGLGWMGRMHTALDWTRGCIAVTDDEIERLWELVPDGAKVEIRP